MIKESLLQSCREYHSQINLESNTRPQKKTHTQNKHWMDNKEGLHNTLSADLLTSRATCQFSQNIHDFSQEIRCRLKLMAQHDQWKSPSVIWWILFPDQPWNEHTTTKNAGTENPHFYRQQRRAAWHTKRWLTHGGCKGIGASGWRVG